MSDISCSICITIFCAFFTVVQSFKQNFSFCFHFLLQFLFFFLVSNCSLFHFKFFWFDFVCVMVSIVLFEFCISFFLFSRSSFWRTINESTRCRSTYHFDKYYEIIKYHYILIIIRPCADILLVLRYTDCLVSSKIIHVYIKVRQSVCVRVCDCDCMRFSVVILFYTIYTIRFVCSTEFETYVFNSTIVYFIIPSFSELFSVQNTEPNRLWLQV